MSAAQRETEIAYLLRQLVATGDGAPDLEEKLRLAQAIRGHSPETAARLDRFLVEEIGRARLGLAQARESQEKLKEVLEKLTAPPWHPAIFLGAVESERGPAAMVAVGNARRVVTPAGEVDLGALQSGDEVLLSNELNAIMRPSPGRVYRCGETASFERYTGDGRLVIRSRDEEIVVEAAGALAGTELRAGEQVRWDRNIWMAFDRVERSSGSHLFLEETPSETFAAIGGLDREIEQLQRTIRLHLRHAETVRKYGLRRKAAVLLVGPPGTGKTMLARALANWLGQLSGAGRARFMNVKPAALHSMWYSQSEANYREVFRVAREAAAADPSLPVTIFFDEVDTIGASRGESIVRVDDRVLTAFMCELDGLESRGNILVVAASNRRDRLDPALLRPGRLGDLILEIPRPNRRAAREIFGKYLTPALPYAESGPESDQGAARERLIESAVSRIYAPNGDADLAVLVFRDGTRRAVRPRDRVSGAGIAKIAQSSVERACLREIESGAGGLRLEDVLDAIAEEFESEARALTPGNCRQHLEGLPQDVDVVRVDRVERKVARPYRYLDFGTGSGPALRSVA